MSRGRFALWTVFGLLAFVAMGATLVIFELRYMWFVSRPEFALLRSIEISGIGLLVALWMLFPSRLGAAAVGVAMLVAPSFIPSSKFVPLDAGFLPWVCLSALLLAAASQINIKARRTVGFG